MKPVISLVSCPILSILAWTSGVYGTFSVVLGNSFSGLCPHPAELAQRELAWDGSEPPLVLVEPFTVAWGAGSEVTSICKGKQ